MAQNRNSRWRPSAILEFLYHHRTTHEVFALGEVYHWENFMLIRYIVLKNEDSLCGFVFFLLNWLEMPIHAPKISFFGVWTPKRN